MLKLIGKDMEQIYYRYLRLELAQFAIFEDNVPQNIEEAQFNSQVQFFFDKEQNVIGCEIEITMEWNDKPLMKAVMRSYFEIQDKSIEQIKDEYGKILFAQSVLIQFASLNYGALRGVIFLKTQETPLARFILPPVFFNNIIKDPFIPNV